YALSLRRRCRSDGVRAQAASADARAEHAHGHGHTAHLQVGLEPPVNPVLGVRDVMSVLRLLAANRTAFGHESPSEGEIDRKKGAKARRAHPGVLELYHGLSMASKTPTALGQAQQWGRIEVFPSAVAAIAGHAALSCYGARTSTAVSRSSRWTAAWPSTST